MTNWRLLYKGNVLADQPRHIMIADSVFSHLSHHRGQLAVYLRRKGAPVPAVLRSLGGRGVTCRFHAAPFDIQAGESRDARKDRFDHLLA